MMHNPLIVRICLEGTLEKITLSKMTPNTSVSLYLDAQKHASFESDDMGFAELVLNRPIPMNPRQCMQLEFQ